MDFDALRTLPGTTQEEFDRIQAGILALATSETKRYTWEEKIDGLAKLAKATGTFLHLLDEKDYDSQTYKKMRQNIYEAYDEFCEWRHDEPYVVDEIKALLAQYEVSPLTGEIIRRSMEGDDDEQ